MAKAVQVVFQKVPGFRRFFVLAGFVLMNFDVDWKDDDGEESQARAVRISRDAAPR